MSFENLNLIKSIKSAIDEEGYLIPTPIQEKAIPIILQGKDLLGSAQTGTGKTAAFAIPILQILSEEKAKYPRDKSVKKKFTRFIKALIITPTRELAVQVSESFSVYGKHTGLHNTVIYGGVSQNPQTEKLKKGVEILIATPGRLLDLMEQKFVDVSKLKILVLDEADRMLDMGFIHDVKKIISKLPKERQSLFFSATMPPEVSKLAHSILNHPVKVEIEPEIKTVEAIEQAVYFVERTNKKKLLIHLIKNENITSALVFTRTKRGAEVLAKQLNAEKIHADAIHGDKTQHSRQRALNDFKANKLTVLVATDIASRGIDIEKLSHVINYDIPEDPETYIHRVGRTGRAGLGGTAISFCDAEERSNLKSIQRLINAKIPMLLEHPFKSDAVANIDQSSENISEKKKKFRGDKKFRRDRKFSGDKKFSGRKSGRKEKFWDRKKKKKKSKQKS